MGHNTIITDTIIIIVHNRGTLHNYYYTIIILDHNRGTLNDYYYRSQTWDTTQL